MKMATVMLRDRSGNSFKVFEWDGYYLPFTLKGRVKPGRLIDRLNDWDFYSTNDILIAAYPRSGNHWLCENVNMLDKKKLSVTDWKLPNIEMKIIDPEAETPVDNIHQTHLFPEVVPTKLKSAKIIYIYRNPKDVAWSYYNFSKIVLKYEGTFDDYVECFLEGKGQIIMLSMDQKVNEFDIGLEGVNAKTYGSWFEHTLAWETFAEERNICVVSFEDMFLKPIETLRRISDYLNLDVNNEFLESVYKACHIDNLKHKTTVIDGIVMNKLVRKGGVGGWKEHFTVSSSERFDQVFKKKMKHCKFQFKFESDS